MEMCVCVFVASVPIRRVFSSIAKLESTYIYTIYTIYIGRHPAGSWRLRLSEKSNIYKLRTAGRNTFGERVSGAGAGGCTAGGRGSGVAGLLRQASAPGGQTTNSRSTTERERELQPTMRQANRESVFYRSANRQLPIQRSERPPDRRPDW